MENKSPSLSLPSTTTKQSNEKLSEDQNKHFSKIKTNENDQNSEKIS